MEDNKIMLTEKEVHELWKSGHHTGAKRVCVAALAGIFVGNVIIGVTEVLKNKKSK